MFTTVVVPLDGSELAERALPYAVHFAAERGGRLVLVRAAIAPPPVGLDWQPPQLDIMTEVNDYLVGIAGGLAPRVAVTIAPIYGRAADEIQAAVEQFAADSIVMATHGRTGLAHLLYGSVAEAVLAHSSVPVFVVHARPGEAAPAPFGSAAVRVMVPLDGSTFAEAALPLALEIVGTGGELVLSSVAPAPDHVERDAYGRARAYLDQQEEASTRDTIRYLHQVEAKLKREYPRVRITIDVRIGDPAAGIVIAEIDRAADLVVMATHGRTGIQRAVLGSVAGAVLRTGAVPVLLVSSGVSAVFEHQRSPGGMVAAR